MLASDDEVMSKPRYYTALALLIFGGIAAASIDLHQFPKTERAIHALADALIIAPLLAITVDTYLKKWLLKEASFDIFQFMLGYTLPRGVTDRLKSLVQATALLRRDCELRWILTWTDDTKNSVRVRLDVTYFVENLSHEDRSYSQTAMAQDV